MYTFYGVIESFMEVYISLVALCSLIFVSAALQHVNAAVECTFSVSIVCLSIFAV